jgi:diaminohydroxyphosphoribosylaminopyrimidine deaminase/5-amino-6-(5-phosphoribosylamino)uracil reductase
MNRNDSALMARAIALAKKGWYTTDPNPRVGCVLVKAGNIIAEGWHQRAGGPHAEIAALQQVESAQGASCYVTLEPCSHHGRTGPCCDALIQAGVSRVIVAMQDPNPLVSGQGIEKMRAAGIEVDVGVLSAEAEALNPGFIKRMRHGLPWICSKLAMSLDGRTAMASGESQWITSPQSRADVHRFRAESSAVLTGINTVLQDDPLLNPRVDFSFEPPVRVVLDSSLQMPLNAKMLHQNDAPVWIITCCTDENKWQTLTQAGAKVFTVASENGRGNLQQVFSLLAKQQINQVWVEAGATLNGALLQSGLVDEWLFYMAPCVMGDGARGLFHLPELEKMVQRYHLSFDQVRKIGPDLRLTLTTKS